MKRKSAADKLVAAIRKAAAIAKGEAEPAAVHQFPLPLEVDVRCGQPPASAARSLRDGSHSTRAPRRIGSKDGGGRIARREPI